MFQLKIFYNKEKFPQGFLSESVQDSRLSIRKAYFLAFLGTFLMQGMFFPLPFIK